MSNDDPMAASFQSIEEALEFGPPAFKMKSADDFDHYLDYLLSLLKASEVLFNNGHFHLAAFIAITAIEETSRASITPYQKTNTKRGKGRDPLKNHLEKQKAALTVVFTSDRMHELFGGEEHAIEFHRKIINGYFNKLREQSLYCFTGKNSFIRPTEYVNITMAREVVLVAIEAVDDCFCGLTKHSYEVSNTFDAMFERIRHKKP